MALLTAIIIGLVVGVLVGFIMQGTFASAAITAPLGLCGAILGNVCYIIFSSTEMSYLFTWGGLLSQLVGAIVLVAVYNFLRHATPETAKKHASEEHIHQQQ